jgi:magnesium and cobalt transporter
MDLLSIDAPLTSCCTKSLTQRIRVFPFTKTIVKNIIGILMAKDLLKLQRAPELNIRALLRPAVFVPESKGLNDLLRQFRDNRQHLAIVIDEFGARLASSPLKMCLKKLWAKLKTSLTLKKRLAISLV